MSYGLFSALFRENDSDDEPFNIKLSIINNIKMIIESQNPMLDIPDAYPMVKKSILDYGMIPSLLSSRHYNFDQLCKELERLVATYEPRMNQITVSLLEVSEQSNSIRLHIAGVIRSEAEKTPLAINSTINLSDIRFTVDW